MGRWEPNARQRFEEAALALCEAQGYERTTAAQIATRAGLTERTFFRHFPDKREALFANDEDLRALLTAAVAGAPAAASPLAAVTAGLAAVAERLAPRREALRRRAAIVDVTPELRERELTKLAAWVEVLAEALRRRGVEEPDAALAAECAIAALRVATEHWLAGQRSADLPAAVRDALDRLSAFGAGR